MGIRLCVLVVFITSVCQGAAVPSQRLDCVTNALDNDYINLRSSLRQSPEPCVTGQQFSARRKRQVEAAQQVNVQPTDTSTQPTVTEAKPQVENSTSAVLNSTLTTVLPSDIVPSLPPPPRPSAAQATAVKPRSCKSGSTWEEECNTCWCLDNGMAACTVKRCEVVSPLTAAKKTLASPVEMTQSATTSVQSSTPVESPTSSAQSSPSEQPSTTPVQSSPTPIQSPSTPSQSSTTSVQSSTTSAQSSTTSAQSSTTSAQFLTTYVQSETTPVLDSSSVVPTSSTTPMQSSTSSSGGTS